MPLNRWGSELHLFCQLLFGQQAFVTKTVDLSANRFTIKVYGFSCFRMVFLSLELRSQRSFPGTAFQFITVIRGHLADAPDDAAPMVCDSGAIGILFGAGPFRYKSGSAARE